jgi:hypothetical protein
LSSWLGIQLLRLLRFEAFVFQLIGFGILIGGVSTALLALLLTNFGIANDWTLVLTLILGVIVWQINQRQVVPSSFDLQHDQWRQITTRSVAIALIGLNTFSLWTTLIGCAILLLPRTGLVVIQHQRTRRIVSSLIIGVSAPLALILFRLQPTWWHGQSNDAPFFEALGWSLAHFGSDSHPGFLGGSVSGYHFLAYLWSGTLSDLGAAEPFLVLHLILPFLEVLSMALILVVPIQKRVRVTTGRTLIVLLLVLSFRYTSFTSASLAGWSLVCYSAVQFSSLQQQQKGLRSYLQSQVILGIFGIIAILGKGTALPIVFALGVATASAQLFADRRSLGNYLGRSLPIHLAVVALVAWLWYSTTASSRLFETADPSPISTLRQFGPNEGLWLSRDIFAMLPALILIGIFALTLSGRSKDSNDQKFLRTLFAFCLLTTVLLFVSPESTARNYIGNHSLAVLLSFGVLIFNVPIKMTTHKIVFLSVVGVACLTSLSDIFWIPQIVRNLWSSSLTPRTRWIPHFLSVSWIPLSLIALAIILTLNSHLLRRKSPDTPNRRQVFVLSIFPLFVLNVGIWNILNRIDQLPSKLTTLDYSAYNSFGAAHPDSATTELGGWMRANTPSDAIVASNSFCCAGAIWLETALEQINSSNTNYRSLRNGESAYGGANYLLSAVVQRRFLVAGPRFVIGGTLAEQTIADYLEWSVRFGLTAESDLAERMHVVGADYFILDKFALGEEPEPVFSKPTLYTNERYVVIDLSLH